MQLDLASSQPSPGAQHALPQQLAHASGFGPRQMGTARQVCQRKLCMRSNTSKIRRLTSTIQHSTMRSSNERDDEDHDKTAPCDRTHDEVV